MSCATEDSLFDRNITQTYSQVGCADRRIHGFVGIVRQHIDIGYIPTMPRLFYLGIPPAVLGDDHAGVDARVQLGPLFFGKILMTRKFRHRARRRIYKQDVTPPGRSRLPVTAIKPVIVRVQSAQLWVCSVGTPQWMQAGCLDFLNLVDASLSV